MKNLILFMCLLFTSSINAHAQAVWTGNGLTGSSTRTGNVGIGISFSPSEKLTVSGNQSFRLRDNYAIMGDVTLGQFSLYPSGASNNGPFIEMYGGQHATRPGLMALGSFGTSGETWFTHYNTSTNAWEIQAKITSDGKFLIGDVSPWTATKYGLYVQDGILTEQVKVAVKTTNDWSDYVFTPTYKLMPIKEVAKYIKTHQHLPNVPSAKEVVKEGINMAKMDAKLLEKIEELTLYTIELNKQVEAMQKKIFTLENKN